MVANKFYESSYWQGNEGNTEYNKVKVIEQKLS